VLLKKAALNLIGKARIKSSFATSTFLSKVCETIFSSGCFTIKTLSKNKLWVIEKSTSKKKVFLRSEPTSTNSSKTPLQISRTIRIKINKRFYKVRKKKERKTKKIKKRLKIKERKKRRGLRKIQRMEC
jgi:hypothetical protein